MIRFIAPKELPHSGRAGGLRGEGRGGALIVIVSRCWGTCRGGCTEEGTLALAVPGSLEIGFGLGEFLSIFGEVIRVMGTGPPVSVLSTLEFGSQAADGCVSGGVVLAMLSGARCVWVNTA